MACVNKFTVDFFIFHILRVVTRKILFDCCLALLDFRLRYSRTLRCAQRLAVGTADADASARPSVCVTHAPRLWRGRIPPDVPFFLFFYGYLSSKSDIRIFLPILSYSIKFIPFQTENATFLPHKFISSATSKKFENFLIARSYSYGQQESEYSNSYIL